MAGSHSALPEDRKIRATCARALRRTIRAGTAACSVSSMKPGMLQHPSWRMGTNGAQQFVLRLGPRQRVASASISGKKASSVPNLSVQRPHNRSTPCCDSRSIAVSMNAVLPIPASPVTKAICLWPASMCCVIRSSISRGTTRPTSWRDRGSGRRRKKRPVLLAHQFGRAWFRYFAGRFRCERRQAKLADRSGAAVRPFARMRQTRIGSAIFLNS